MNSIRTQITAITVVAILTSILSVFLASFLNIKSETNQNSVQVMNLIDQDTQKSLEKYFESIEQSVEIAANIAIEDMDSVFLVDCGAVHVAGQERTQTMAQVAELEEYLDGYYATIQAFFAGVADYTQGVTGYYFCLNPELCPTRPGFFYRKVGKTGFIEQEPLDVLALEPVEPLGKTWYDAGVEHGRPAWLGPYLCTTGQDDYICSYMVPIYKAGLLIGLMGMDIPCSTLIEQIRDIRVYDSGYVALVDAELRVIYYPDLPLGSDLGELDLSIDPELLQTQDNGDALIRYAVAGEERQLSFSTLSNGMKILCIAPAAEINAPWIRLVKAILIITALVIVVYTVVTTLLMGAITAPLQQLTAASRRLADADYDVDLSYRGRNEIGTLTVAFNKMRDQLKRYIDDLNHQIYFDRLTDIPNMRYFFTLAVQTRDLMLSEGKEPVMLYFNIVGLRHYNRQQGFDQGDQAITRFGKLLAEEFGLLQVCRFNGDQFAAVSDEENAEAKVKALFKAWEKEPAGHLLPICVGAYPNRLEMVDVNVAYDRAKYAGNVFRDDHNSTYTVFNEDMLRRGEVYAYIVHNLDKALEQGWIKVYYQPIVRAADEKVCDEEALARWIDPKYGFLSPGDFIPALEQSKLIYKLDLYIVDEVLKKMKKQTEAGLYLVPQSINLSRIDFERCDVVEEIRRRVDAAGFPRHMITVEITESVIGGDFAFMKEQVARFRALGFPVWMDDFGSGYSSLDVLQQIRFDLIKFDMRFMERFGEGEESRIILTELMKMAIGLGTETVCEGVEEREQVDFLREIGCTRIQGYYYGKPIPFEGILNLFHSGSKLEFENPAESEYYASIGRINLYDMSAITDENDEAFDQYFNTLPMSIMEVDAESVRFVRCNRSYRDFLERTVGIPYDTQPIEKEEMNNRVGTLFLRAVLQCGKDGKRTVIDERIREGAVAHTLIRRVAVNPVTGTAAIAVVVLAVVREDQDGTNYSQMARALAVDYMNLFYVNLETERFIEYSPDDELEDLVMERHGEAFFTASRRDALSHLYKEDQADFVAAFTKENVIETLDREGQFALSYRLMLEGKPVYVALKAVRMPNDKKHMLVGVTNVDAAMREKAVLSRMRTEQSIYARISALNQNFVCIYTIDPETNRFVEYRAAKNYAGLGIPTEGEDFWAQSNVEATRLIFPEDLLKFQSLMTRENILRTVRQGGTFSLQYRMMLGGAPRYMSLKAVLVEEQENPLLIIGVNDIDDQVRREQDYENQLSTARRKANLDTLTGVKNRSAYETMSETLTQQIESGQSVQYAILICRVNGVGWVNETQGREEGNRLIREACNTICTVFKHSPVFRIGGDRFAVIALGHDYNEVDALAERLLEENRTHTATGALPLAMGMAKYDGASPVAAIFHEAESRCK